MSKKSAHSKGNRTTHEHTTGYTPREKKIMIFGFAGIIVVLACLIVLPDLPDYVDRFHRLFYDYITVEDGAVQGVGDNWLIANLNDSANDPAYVKLAEIGEIEGYELSESNYVSDENVLYHDYAPTGESVAQTLRFMPPAASCGDVRVVFCPDQHGRHRGALPERGSGDRHQWAFRLCVYRRGNGAGQ